MAIQGKGAVEGIDYSPNGKFLTVAYSCADGGISLYNVKSLEELRFVEMGWAKSTAFYPDRQILAGGVDGNILQLWRVADGSLPRTLEGHTDIVMSVVFSPDGQLLVSGGQDTTVRLWRVADGALLYTLEHTADNWVWDIAFSPDGQTLASGSHDGTVRLWRVTDGTLLHTLEGHTDQVNCVAFSPNGKTLASGAR